MFTGWPAGCTLLSSSRCYSLKAEQNFIFLRETSALFIKHSNYLDKAPYIIKNNLFYLKPTDCPGENMKVVAGQLLLKTLGKWHMDPTNDLSKAGIEAWRMLLVMAWIPVKYSGD
jgi:hypothetical protein